MPEYINPESSVIRYEVVTFFEAFGGYQFFDDKTGAFTEQLWSALESVFALNLSEDNAIERGTFDEFELQILNAYAGTAGGRLFDGTAEVLSQYRLLRDSVVEIQDAYFGSVTQALLTVAEFYADLSLLHPIQQQLAKVQAVDRTDLVIGYYDRFVRWNVEWEGSLVGGFVGGVAGATLRSRPERDSLKWYFEEKARMTKGFSDVRKWQLEFGRMEDIPTDRPSGLRFRDRQIAKNLREYRQGWEYAKELRKGARFVRGAAGSIFSAAATIAGIYIQKKREGEFLPAAVDLDVGEYIARLEQHVQAEGTTRDRVARAYLAVINFIDAVNTSIQTQDLGFLEQFNEQMLNSDPGAPFGILVTFRSFLRGLRVRWSPVSVYYYNVRSNGDHVIERMVALAEAQDGLNAYIKKKEPAAAWNDYQSQVKRDIARADEIRERGYLRRAREQLEREKAARPLLVKLGEIFGQFGHGRAAKAKRIPRSLRPRRKPRAR